MFASFFFLSYKRCLNTGKQMLFLHIVQCTWSSRDVSSSSVRAFSLIVVWLLKCINIGCTTAQLLSALAASKLRYLLYKVSHGLSLGAVVSSAFALRHRRVFQFHYWFLAVLTHRIVVGLAKRLTHKVSITLRRNTATNVLTVLNNYLVTRFDLFTLVHTVFWVGNLEKQSKIKG